jgi:hypothetical protein
VLEAARVFLILVPLAPVPYYEKKKKDKLTVAGPYFREYVSLRALAILNGSS